MAAIVQNREETIYVHGHSEEHRAFLSGRIATREAAFFLPFLKPGMRLLDCGCGDPQFMPFIYRVMIKPTTETIRPWLIEHGLTDEARLDAMLAEALAWSGRPDAFIALLQCAAVAWAP